MVDHPIFTESIRRIRALLGETGLGPLEQQVLERLVHSSGDPGLLPLLQFSEGACARAVEALTGGAVILTDTAMAAAAVAPMGILQEHLTGPMSLLQGQLRRILLA